MKDHCYDDIQAVKTAVTDRLCSIPESLPELLHWPSEMLATVYHCRGRIFHMGQTTVVSILYSFLYRQSWSLQT